MSYVYMLWIVRDMMKWWCLLWIEYDMKLLEYAHRYGYDLMLESDNMGFLMKFWSLWFMAIWDDYDIKCTMW